MSKRIEGDGPSKCKIVLVGEAPGADEELQGKPFVGSSGTLLWTCLSKLGINRSDVYVTNVIKVRPPQNKLERLHELGHTIEEFYPELFDEIKSREPNLVVAIGGVALKALCGLDSPTKWRGSLLSSDTLGGIKVLPIEHPSYCLRQWNRVHILNHDIKKLTVESEFPEIRRIEREYIINPTFDQAISELNRLENSLVPIVIDLETTMKGGIIKCVGLSNSKEKAVCIPFVKSMTPCWSESETRLLWERITHLLLTKKIIAQNAQFEMTQLAPHTGGKMRIYFDTMRAHTLLYSELPHGLDFLTSIYTDLAYYKDDGKVGDETGGFDKLQIYNCKDCVATYEVYEKLSEELREAGQESFYHKFDTPLLHCLWRAQRRGVRIDMEALKEHREFIGSELEGAQRELDECVGYPVNVKSTKAMAKLLYEELGLPIKYHKKTGNQTTNADAIEQLGKKFPHVKPLQLILSVRKFRTLSETFLSIEPEDGKVHTSYGMTDTGRLRSGADITGSGINLQNIPGQIRNIYVPDEGKVMIKGDLSQAEARIVAWLAQDDTLKAIFRSGQSVHKMVASLIFGMKPEEVSKESKEYKLAKNMVHASNYAVGVRTFANHVGVEVKEAEKVMREYEKLFPNIKGVFHAGVEAQLRKNRTLINPLGRKRVFFERWGDELKRSAYSHIPQSTVADVINTCWIALDEGLPSGAEVLMQVHDELVLQCYPEQVDLAARMFKKEVEIPLTINGDILVIPVELSVGPNWKDTKSYEVY